MFAVVLQSIQIVIALGLLNVWLLRFNKSTAYRGGEAKNLIEEFAVYGLPTWFCYAVGFLKVSAALALLFGFVFPELIAPAAALIAVLMLGAVTMHVKVRDSLKKTTPALVMLVLSLTVAISANPEFL
jgi:hypothetical protein